MDAREFVEWVAYESLEGPVGRHRTNALLATLCLIAANMFRGKGRRAFKYEDFMPEHKPPKPSKEEIIARLNLFAQVHNAQFEKKN
ncbi:MAG: hypothetical protein ACE5FM_08410 [Methyloligellaceae bacterium]